MNRERPSHSEGTFRYRQGPDHFADLLTDGLLFKLAVHIGILYGRLFGTPEFEGEEFSEPDFDYCQ